MVASTTPVSDAVLPSAGPNEPASESTPTHSFIGSAWLNFRGGSNLLAAPRLSVVDGPSFVAFAADVHRRGPAAASRSATAVVTLATTTRTAMVAPTTRRLWRRVARRAR